MDPSFLPQLAMQKDHDPVIPLRRTPIHPGRNINDEKKTRLRALADHPLPSHAIRSKSPSQESHKTKKKGREEK
jgi:hypothetical protein